MATTTTKFAVESVANLWDRCLAAWLGVLSGTSTYSYALTTEASCIAVQSDVTAGTNITRSIFYVPNHPSALKVPLHYIQRCPTWNVQQGLQGVPNAAHTVATEWTSIMFQLRKDLITNYTQCTIANSGTDIVAVAYDNIKSYQMWICCQDAGRVYHDFAWTEILTAALVYSPISFVTMQAANQTPNGSVTIDTSRIESALQDISQMDTDISINNGAATYSVRGRTVS